MQTDPNCPSARLSRLGAESLTDEELLSITLRLTLPRVSELITKYGSAQALLNADRSQLARTLSPAKSAALISARELCGRVSRAKKELIDLSDPSHVYEHLRAYRSKQKEHFIALYVNARNKIIREEVVSVGTLTASLVHPREVFGPAVQCSAAGVIVAHNHPSGDQNPSADDGAATRRLERAGRILGVPLLDHVVIAEGGYYSFRENGGLSA